MPTLPSPATPTRKTRGLTGLALATALAGCDPAGGGSSDPAGDETPGGKGDDVADDTPEIMAEADGTVVASGDLRPGHLVLVRYDVERSVCAAQPDTHLAGVIRSDEGQELELEFLPAAGDPFQEARVYAPSGTTATVEFFWQNDELEVVCSDSDDYTFPVLEQPAIRFDQDGTVRFPDAEPLSPGDELVIWYHHKRDVCPGHGEEFIAGHFDLDGGEGQDLDRQTPLVGGYDVYLLKVPEGHERLSLWFSLRNVLNEAICFDSDDGKNFSIDISG